MPQIAVIVGSKNDMEAVRSSGMLEIFRRVGVSFELSVISAHRNAKELRAYCAQASARGFVVFIGVAGMAAALPGAIAGHLRAVVAQRVVIGVPLPSVEFPDALDALLATVRMPKGIPVLVSGIGEAGLVNAAYAACQVVAVGDKTIENQLAAYVATQAKPAKVSLEAFDGRNKNE